MANITYLDAAIIFRVYLVEQLIYLQREIEDLVKKRKMTPLKQGIAINNFRRRMFRLSLMMIDSYDRKTFNMASQFFEDYLRAMAVIKICKTNRDQIYDEMRKSGLRKWILEPDSKGTGFFFMHDLAFTVWSAVEAMYDTLPGLVKLYFSTSK